MIIVGSSPRSSSHSESVVSEIDPLFRSLTEPTQPIATSTDSTPTTISYSSHPSNPLSSPATSTSSLTHSPLSIPTNVSFPLPPRRLRPGELLGFSDHPVSHPTSHHHPLSASNQPPVDPFVITPVSLYGVAIGGSHPSRSTPIVNGRAQVQTSGLSSLDLRKMSLRNRSISNPRPHPIPHQLETFNLRARNPSRMLAPHNLNLQSPSRPHLTLPSRLPPQHHLVFTHPIRNPTSPTPNTSSSPPPPPSQPNHPPSPPRHPPLIQSFPHLHPHPHPPPIPRFPPTRLAPHQRSSSHLTHPKLYVQATHQPLSETFSSLVNSRRNLRPDSFISLSSVLSDNDSEKLALAMHPSAGLDSTLRSHGRIKFAPLPSKSTPSPISVCESLNLIDERQIIKSKLPAKKKSAWLQRWLVPISKPASNRVSPAEISLPVPDTLILTGSGTAVTTPTVPVLTIKRRNSVNDHTPQGPPPSKPPRPRSRSFNTVRPTLGMMSNLVQGSASCSVGRTVMSGQILLDGSRSTITSPIRAHSLQHLFTGVPTSSLIKPSPRLEPHLDHNLTYLELRTRPSTSPGDQPKSQTNTIPSSISINQQDHHHPIDLPSSTLGPPTLNLEGKAANSSSSTSEVNPTTQQVLPSLPGSTMVASSAEVVERPKLKKREIRFRNTLELIPDPTYLEPPEPERKVNQTSVAGSELSLPRTTSSFQSNSEVRSSESKRLKMPIKNLSFFNHARKEQQQHSGLQHPDDSTGPSSSTSLSFGPYHNRRTQHHQRDDNQVDDGLNLLNRKLAPKINLTFVDLDHHIGSRFSVNTLLREVQKTLPDVKPIEEEISFGGKLTSSIDINQPYGYNSSLGQVPHHENSSRTYSLDSDPDTRVTEMPSLISRKRQESGSEAARSEGRDGSSSETLESPTTLTSVSNPAEMEPPSKPFKVPRRSDSGIEVVQTNGDNVVFEMVVPLPQSARMNSKERGIVSRRGTPQSDSSQFLSPGREEDELMEISERLVALHKSIEAQEVQVARSQAHQTTDASAPNNREGKTRVSARRKADRIESWLSSVPSPLSSPLHVSHCSDSNLDHDDRAYLSVDRDYFETLDHESECPESPIDRHHHIPPRLSRKLSKAHQMPTSVH